MKLRKNYHWIEKRAPDESEYKLVLFESLRKELNKSFKEAFEQWWKDNEEQFKTNIAKELGFDVEILNQKKLTKSLHSVRDTIKDKGMHYCKHKKIHYKAHMHENAIEDLVARALKKYLKKVKEVAVKKETSLRQLSDAA